jgi:thiosulfate/3-mercaptopyruvate sulfurtransferase
MSWNSELIVSTDWLADHLSDPNIAILDGSWHLPPEKRDGAAEFLVAHIPGARFFDIDRIADTSQGLPHMLPPDAMFAAKMAEMGIGNDTHVVVYDSKGLFSAPRVWWTLRVMGGGRVSVLDGGLPKWTAEGRPLEMGQARARAAKSFRVHRDATSIRSIDDVRAVLKSGGAQLVDARPAGRFTGEVPEPRPGLTQGHMPGARNVPFNTLVNADGTLKSEAELRAVLAAAGVDAAKPVVASCGSGVTASMVALALTLLGNGQAAVYDGSWAEWGRDSANPVVKGPA